MHLQKHIVLEFETFHSSPVNFYDHGSTHKTIYIIVTGKANIIQSKSEFI